MKRYLYLYIVALASIFATSCNHKELCEDARMYHINLHADYRLDWEDTNDIDWKSPGCWPEHYLAYDNLRPNIPDELLLAWDYKNGRANYLNYTKPGGGVINLGNEYTNLLIHNDSEYNDIHYSSDGTIVRATTRASTRASFKGYKLGEVKEETKKSPDLLFANYFENFQIDKTLNPTDFYTTLQPLVFTYYIRIPIKSGLEYVKLNGHSGDISGMADGVNLLNGETVDNAVTILFDNTEDYGYRVINVTDWGIEAIVRSYGLPGYPQVNYPTRTNVNYLGINIYTGGKVVRFECDITDQMRKQPHGGVIEWSGEDIVIEKDSGVAGSGAFDVEVEGWNYEDVILPII